MVRSEATVPYRSTDVVVVHQGTLRRRCRGDVVRSVRTSRLTQTPMTAISYGTTQDPNQVSCKGKEADQ